MCYEQSITIHHVSTYCAVGLGVIELRVSPEATSLSLNRGMVYLHLTLPRPYYSLLLAGWVCLFTVIKISVALMLNLNQTHFQILEAFV